MFVERIEQVLPCFSDPWKLRIIAHLNSPPDLKEIVQTLNARYSESLGVVLVRLGKREVNFFAGGKVTIREVNDIDEGKKLVRSILEMVGLSPELYLTRMMDKSLSGGERKRIELASIVALEPKLAILDEPDSGIDMLSIQDIINVINVLKKNGAAVLLITHREEIGKIADRASQICNGKIICSGDPEMVAQYYKSRKWEVSIPGVCIYV